MQQKGLPMQKRFQIGRRLWGLGRRSFKLLGIGIVFIAVPGVSAAPADASQCKRLVDAGDFQLNAPKADRIAALADDMIAKHIAPGAVLMVEHRGKTILSHVTGLADKEHKKPMAADALFRIYSMTKPVTSVAIMQLVEQGKISLDDPAHEYLPALQNMDVWVGDTESVDTEPLDRPILIRDLLRHTAGIVYRGGKGNPVRDLYNSKGVPAGPGVDSAPADGSERVTSLPGLVERISKIPLLHQPGAAFTYGNSTDLLGRIVEIVSDKSLSDYFRSEIFQPLKMDDTGFQISSDQVGRMTSAYFSPAQSPEGQPVLGGLDVTNLKPATLSRVDDGQASIYAKTPDIQFGGAGLVSSAADYLRFTRAIRQGGTLDGNRIIGTDSVREMIRDQLPDAARDDASYIDRLGFGYGFAVRTAATSEEPVFPRCAAFWGGAASTYFWIDTASETSGVLMTQVFSGDVRSYWLAMMENLYGAPLASGSDSPHDSDDPS